MKVTFWGTRGSVAAPGPDPARYGGNTSCVQVCSDDGTVVVLDAGTGIRRLGDALPAGLKRVDILLTHLHMDHLQGLGFFAPLDIPGIEVHIWGPASTTLSLRNRLLRYMSPPLFPVHLRDLPCSLNLHEVPGAEEHVGPFTVTSERVCHPGPTVGYRIAQNGASLAYIPDHEPALGARRFPVAGEWTSGFELARGVDLLIHDCQFTADEYAARVGWGHSALQHAFDFGALARVKQLAPFHHDPAHDDGELDRYFSDGIAESHPAFPVTPAMEGLTIAI
ncbi:MAG: MBL fold metallo-hydrolase [Acidobacteriota bacterium]